MKVFHKDGFSQPKPTKHSPKKIYKCELFDSFYVDWPVSTYAFNCVWNDGKINKKSEKEWERKKKKTKLWNGACASQKKRFECNKLIKHVYMSGKMKRKLKTQELKSIRTNSNKHTQKPEAKNMHLHYRLSFLCVIPVSFYILRVFFLLLLVFVFVIYPLDCELLSVLCQPLFWASWRIIWSFRFGYRVIFD